MNKPYPPVDYSGYLRLDQLLSAQSPKSVEYGRPAHDETLFIVVHQVYELWFKQILHELDSVLLLFRDDSVDERNIGIAASRLHRITQIQQLLIEQLHVLETMTPLDFLDFRDLLIPASGFQSVQFRLIETKLGLRGDRRVPLERGPAEGPQGAQQDSLRRAADEPSLFTLVERWLTRIPFLEWRDYRFWSSYREAVDAMLTSDRLTITSNPTLSEDERQAQLRELQATESSFAALLDEATHDRLVREGQRRLCHRATLAALLIHLYRDQPILHLPFRFLTLLVEVDERLSTWRYRHALMVHRMIGTKIGTGGSSGHQYLKQTVERNRIFADFFNLSTFLIPRTALPRLGEDLERRLGFYYPRE